MPGQSQALLGGKYKVQVWVHRSVLMNDYCGFRLHEAEFQASIRTTARFKESLHLSILPPIVLGHCNTMTAFTIRVIRT